MHLILTKIDRNRSKDENFNPKLGKKRKDGNLIAKCKPHACIVLNIRIEVAA